ncbi:MAG: hypothetical protein AAB802_04275, partial [Patescibacteria group bacterium]
MKNKKNLLVLGASGTVAHGVLTYLKRHRRLIANLILLDQDDFKDDELVSLDHLNASFVKLRIEPKTKKEFLALLEKEKIDIVLDLSDAPTEFTAKMVFDYAEASYICVAFCTASFAPLAEALNEWTDVQKTKKLKKPHVLFTGMNPGNVNVWAAMGVKKFGKPLELTEFEYDSSRFMKHHKEKMVTWCVPEFLVELVTDPSQIILGDHRVKTMLPNGLFHTEDLRPLLSPILKLSNYPKGSVIMHEECLTLGNRWNIPCRFIYAVNQETMAFIKKTYEEKGKVEDSDLVIGDNFKDPLLGSDNIGLRLDYKDKAVYYFNSVANENLKVCSGTNFQVAVGVFA